MSSAIIFGIYTRKACTSTFSGTVTNNKNEVGLVSFNQNLNKLSEVSLRDGSKVHVVKSAKYGKNLVVGVGVTASSSGDFLATSINPATDQMFVMLISNSGSIITKETEVKPFSLSPSDDWRVMSDGSVAWTYIYPDGTLALFTLPAPPTTPPAIDPSSYVDSYGNSESPEAIVVVDKNKDGGNGSGSLKSFLSLFIGLVIVILAL
jgi:hypothetical protein